MAKVAIIKPYFEYAKMIGALVEEGGHETLLEVPPVDWERVMNFGPEALVTGVFRKRIAFNRPIENFKDEVLGSDIVETIQSYPAIWSTPTLLLGNAVEERDVPLTLRYDLFLIFPDDMFVFLRSLDELTKMVKSKRKVSGYICPNCGSRLTYLKEPVKDLFCPRCHTAVAIIDHESCLAQDADGKQIACDLSQIAPPRPLDVKPHLE